LYSNYGCIFVKVKSAQWWLKATLNWLLFCSIKVLSYEKSDRWCWGRDPIVNLVELSNLDDQELQARIATCTDAGERLL
jgi:hypothetical protein